ncbi:MAG: hypothetical protein K9N55_02335 [Phycisphaerae bacterium]|nr:hypothetical protein [Phycisphaerae bacterium]
MARYRGQKALYEVIGGRARNKSARAAAEPLRPEKQQAVKPAIKKVPAVVQAKPLEKAAPAVPERKAISWKQKPIQCHDGRLEITLSTRVAIMTALCLIVVCLACFKAGQWYPELQGRLFIDNRNNSPDQTGLPNMASANQPVASRSEPAGTMPQSKAPVIQTVQSDRPSRPLIHGNAIVIQEFDKKADLVAVGRFFDSQGISTEIVSRENTYYLITQERFHYNPASAPQTSGNRLLNEIRLLGKDYKAPLGLESFAPNKFKGAYGRNIDDQYIGEVTDVP